MNINWKTRVKSKAFWAAIVPAALLLVQQACAVFGVTLDLSTLQEQLLGIVDTVFVVLMAVGIVVDHNTKGLSDSIRSLTYDEPWDDFADAKKGE